MSPLGKFRAVMFVALMKVGIFWWLAEQFIPNEWSGFKTVPFFFLGFLGATAAFLLLISLTSGQSDKLWQSWWFRFMRSVWGPM